MEKRINVQKRADQKIGEFFNTYSTRQYRAVDNVPSYSDFFVEAFSVLEPNTRYRHNWHVDYLCDDICQKETDRIARGDPKDNDYVINMMFRSLKSYIFTIAWNAWAWAKYPYISFATGSYAKDLAQEHSSKTRRLIKSEWYQSNFGESYEILRSQDTKTYFANDMGGERKAISVGGQFTGSGSNILVIDDGVKPPQENQVSIKEGDLITANNWWDKTAYSRVNNPEVDLRVMLQQRVATNDLSGHILTGDNKDEYEHVCIPGELTKDLKPDYLKKFYMPDKNTGTKLFFRDRFSSKELKKYENSLQGNYAGQVNQSPTSEKGGKWSEMMFIKIKRSQIPTHFSIVLNTWDLATSKKEIDSASAFVRGGVSSNSLYITDTDYRWVEYPEIIRWISGMNGTHYVENKSSGLNAVPDLQEKMVDANLYENKNKDKEAHTKEATYKASRMNIYIAEDIWDKLLFDDKQGICHYPRSPKDDVNDAFCIHINTAASFMVLDIDIQSTGGMRMKELEGANNMQDSGMNDMGSYSVSDTFDVPY